MDPGKTIQKKKLCRERRGIRNDYEPSLVLNIAHGRALAFPGSTLWESWRFLG